jgi:hypothetical protein
VWCSVREMQMFRLSTSDKSPTHSLTCSERITAYPIITSKMELCPDWRPYAQNPSKVLWPVDVNLRSRGGRLADTGPHIGTNTIGHDVPPRDDRKFDILWTVNPLRQLPSLSHAQPKLCCSIKPRASAIASRRSPRSMASSRLILISPSTTSPSGVLPR